MAQKVTVEIVGMGMGRLVAQFVASLVQRGWSTLVDVNPVVTEPPAEDIRGTFSLKVRVPSDGLDDLRSLIWDLRHNLPPSCFVHSHTRMGEPATPESESVGSVVAADLEQQALWKAETQHLVMDL